MSRRTNARIATLAAELNAKLTRAKRDNGDEFVKLKDDAPEWMTDACHAAHGKGQMLPDDWRYSFVEDAASALENEDDGAPDLDNVYPYTHDRLAWFASRNDRHGFCDEAAEERGEKPDTIIEWVALGMQAELQEVYDQLRAHLEEVADEREADDEDAEDDGDEE